MKRMTGWSLLLCLGLVAEAPADLSSGLIAHYSFDTQNLGRDVSGQGYDGIVTGVKACAGVKGRAAEFTGTENIRVDALKRYPWGSAFAVSLWFNRQGSWGNYACLANIGYNGKGVWEVMMGREDGSQAMWAGVSTFTHPSTKDISGIQASRMKWHHMVMNYDGQSLGFYLDGALVRESQNDSGELMTADIPMMLGVNAPATRQVPFVGYLDEVRLYNRALMQDEISQLFAEGQATAVAVPPRRPAVPAPAPVVEETAPPPRAEVPAAVAPPAEPISPQSLLETPAPPSSVPAPIPVQSSPEPAGTVPAPIAEPASAPSTVEAVRAPVSEVLPETDADRATPEPTPAVLTSEPAPERSMTPAVPIAQEPAPVVSMKAPGQEDCCATVQRWQTLWKQGQKQDVIKELNATTW